MIYLKTDKEKMPNNCSECGCICELIDKFHEKQAGKELTDEEWERGKKELDNRLPNCPLVEMPSRKDLVTEIVKHFSCHNNTHSYMTINQVSKHSDEIADELGFKKEKI